MIRNGKLADLEQLVMIEQSCFLADEAASPEAMKQRLNKISDTFLVAEKEGEIVGYVNGPVIDQLFITDDLFDEIDENPSNGGYQSVLGLAVHKDFQGQSIAGELLKALFKEAVEKQRVGITLTCKAELISFYEKNGYINKGLSESTHGNQKWYNMVADCGMRD